MTWTGTRVGEVNDLPISRAKIRELDNIRKKMAARGRVHGARVYSAQTKNNSNSYPPYVI